MEILSKFETKLCKLFCNAINKLMKYHRFNIKGQAEYLAHAKERAKELGVTVETYVHYGDLTMATIAHRLYILLRCCFDSDNSLKIIPTKETFHLDYESRPRGFRDIIIIKSTNTPYGEIRGEGESLLEAITDFDVNYRRMKEANLVLEEAIHDTKQEKYVKNSLDDLYEKQNMSAESSIKETFHLD